MLIPIILVVLSTSMSTSVVTSLIKIAASPVIVRGTTSASSVIRSIVVVLPSIQKPEGILIIVHCLLRLRVVLLLLRRVRVVLTWELLLWVRGVGCLLRVLMLGLYGIRWDRWLRL